MYKNNDRDMDSPNVSTKVRNVTTYTYYDCLTFKCIILDMRGGMDKYDLKDKWYHNIHKSKNKPHNPLIK